MAGLSVVITCYNMQDCIEACLNSIDQMQRSALELVVVDDGSSDESVRIIQALTNKLAHPVRLICQTNMGPGAARNTGLHAASHEYVCFVDGDDLVDSAVLEEAAKLATHAQSFQAVVTDFSVWHGGDHRGTPVARLPSRITGQPQAMTKHEAMMALTHSGHFACWGIVFPKVAVSQSLTGEALFPVGIIHEDVPATISLIQAVSSVIYLPKVAVLYRQRKGSITHGATHARMDDIPLAYALAKKRLAVEPWPNAVYEQLNMHFASEVVAGLRRHRKSGQKESINVLRRVRNNIFEKDLSTVLRASGLRLKDRIDLFIWLNFPGLFELIKFKR